MDPEDPTRLADRRPRGQVEQLQAVPDEAGPALVPDWSPAAPYPLHPLGPGPKARADSSL
jgi:hypothetical protein